MLHDLLYHPPLTLINRKLKHTGGGGGSPDWPYYKSIERILSKVPEQAHMSPMEPQITGASTSQPEPSVPHAGMPVIGFLPEYTGSSEERDVKEEDDEGTEVSVSSFESRYLGHLHDIMCPDAGTRMVQTYIVTSCLWIFLDVLGFFVLCGICATVIAVFISM